MSQDVIKKTQKVLGKYIKKPPLSEKLLGKPPFRYLHDIFNVVSIYIVNIFIDKSIHIL